MFLIGLAPMSIKEVSIMAKAYLDMSPELLVAIVKSHMVGEPEDRLIKIANPLPRDAILIDVEVMGDVNRFMEGKAWIRLRFESDEVADGDAITPPTIECTYLER